MRVGRGDGSTDDADVCGLRTMRHTRPEVESMCVYMWVRMLDRGVYMGIRDGLTLKSLQTDARSIHHAGRLIKRTITHAGGAVWLARHH
jgi:hypothetical protein